MGGGGGGEMGRTCYAFPIPLTAAVCDSKKKFQSLMGVNASESEWNGAAQLNSCWGLQVCHLMSMSQVHSNNYCFQNWVQRQFKGKQSNLPSSPTQKGTCTPSRVTRSAAPSPTFVHLSLSQ